MAKTAAKAVSKGRSSRDRAFPIIIRLPTRKGIGFFQQAIDLGVEPVDFLSFGSLIIRCIQGFGFVHLRLNILQLMVDPGVLLLLGACFGSAIIGSLSTKLHKSYKCSHFSLIGDNRAIRIFFLYCRPEYPWDGRAICVQSDGIASQCHGLSSEPF